MLDAEHELPQSRVHLVSARRDDYVAGFQLLNAMGEAELRDLGLQTPGEPLYDPTENYRRVTRALRLRARPAAGAGGDADRACRGAIARRGRDTRQQLGQGRVTMAEPHSEPSMEEILASIKRVIAEDRPPIAPMRPRPRPEPGTLLPDGEGVLELDRPVPGTEPLVSPTVSNAARGSFAALAAAVPEPVGDGPLEAVVREMLRPMLRQWLDERLPGIVEELVKREIGRITGRKL